LGLGLSVLRLPKDRKSGLGFGLGLEVLSVHLENGWDKRLFDDLFGVECDVKPNSVNQQSAFFWREFLECSAQCCRKLLFCFLYSLWPIAFTAARLPAFTDCNCSVSVNICIL